MIRLKLWGDGYEQQTIIGIEDTPLLRLSQQALQDIQADEEIGPLIDSEVPPDTRLVRVPTEALDRVMELLKDRGFTVEWNRKLIDGSAEGKTFAGCARVSIASLFIYGP